LSYDDSIHTGGGITQFVKLRSVLAGVHAQLSRYWDFGATCGVGNNEVLDANVGSNSFTTITGTVMLARQVTPSIRLETRYEHIHQTNGTIATIVSGIDRNRFTVRIAYRFKRPLGSIAE
jgi:hypothetical protein